MSQGHPRPDPHEANRAEAVSDRSPSPTEIQYYLRGIRPAAKLAPEQDAPSGNAEMWKGMALLALFVSALAMVIAVATTILLAA